MVDTTITYEPSPGSDPAVAYGSSQYLVVWQYGTAIYGARVTASGNVLDPLGISIAPSGFLPAVAFDGANFLVAWRTDDFGICGARVSPAGVLLDPVGISVCSLAFCWGRPAVASGESACLVVWTDGRDGDTIDIYGARVTRSGIVLDSEGIPIAHAGKNQDLPAVVSDGSNYLVVFRDSSQDSAGDISGVRVSSAGTVLDTAVIPIARASGVQSNPSVSFGDSVYLVAWDDSGRTASQDIYCARVSLAGQVLDTNGIAVCAADSEQQNPAVAFNGMGFLLSWTDFRNNSNSSDIYGARVTQAGIVLDTTGFPVSTAGNFQLAPALALGDSLCLAVWVDYRYGGVSAIFGARINQDGQVLDRTGFVISTTAACYQYTPCAAFNRRNYVVAWEQQGFPERICFSRIAPDGSLLDSAPHTLCSSPDVGPAIAAGESCALVVWTDRNLDGVAGARIAESGTVLDSGGISIMRGCGLPSQASIACDGADWFVVWDEDCAVVGARVSSSGVVLDTAGIPVCDVAECEGDEQVACGDSGYLVVWSDSRFDPRCIVAGRVTRSGAVLDSSGFRVTFDSSMDRAPRIVFGGGGYLVVWQARTAIFPSNYEIRGARLNRNGAVLDSVPILIASPGYDCESPWVTFDGTDYIVAWQDSWCGSINGARVSRWGTVLATFPISRRDVREGDFCLASGLNRQVLALYSADTDSVNHRPVFCRRIWGRLSPFEGIEENPTQVVPRVTLGVLPNPFSSRAEVRYALPMTGRVRLGVYDISGRLVRLLADDEQKAGSHVLRWDGAANDGRLLANGVYILRLDADGRRETRTLIIGR
jgi:hypothetical protein